MTDSRGIDLDVYRIDDGAPRPARSVPRASRKTGLFLMGPVPWPWLCAAGRLKGSALQVAIACHFLAGMSKREEFSLRPSTLREIGVKRHSAYRALEKLEGARLIAVTRGRGRSPLVRILEVKEADGGTQA